MTDEENEAIIDFEREVEDGRLLESDIVLSLDTGLIIKNLLKKQEKEIKHQKEKRENQRKELSILNAKQIEFNKLVNTVNSYKGQFKRQQKEIEELRNEVMEKELMIDGMKEDRRIAVEEIQEQYYVSKDKIKAKIEELDKQEQDLQNSISDEEREEYSDASISWELMDIHTRREVLKQLLDEVEIKDNKEIIKPLDPNEVYFKDGTELVYKLMYNKINELAMTVNKIMEEKK